MSESGPLAPLMAALHDLVTWWKTERIQGVVIGGVAASIRGRPRATRDVDAIVLIDRRAWGEFLATGKRFGFVPRRSDALDFAEETKVLLIHHKPSGIDVDISFGVLPFEEEVVSRAVWIDVGGVRLPLPTPEDLIILKAIAHRPRDLADIESVLDAHPKLNLRRIRRWAQEFATVLEMPEILEDLETFFATRRRKRKR